jgi:hypothetical protein
MGVRAALLALAAAGSGLGPAWPGTAHADRTEPEIKAEFVERFTRFIDWAEKDLPDHELVVCVHGDSPITRHLERIANRRTLRGRRAVVEAVSDPDRLVDCQVVVIAGSDRRRLRAALARTEGRPILTIAETPGAAAAGAIVNFYRDDKHVRFEINPGAARDSRLKVRAKLLRLARVVRSERGGAR